jgi:hypothetical protein
MTDDLMRDSHGKAGLGYYLVIEDSLLYSLLAPQWQYHKKLRTEFTQFAEDYVTRNGADSTSLMTSSRYWNDCNGVSCSSGNTQVAGLYFSCEPYDVPSGWHMGQYANGVYFPYKNPSAEEELKRLLPDIYDPRIQFSCAPRDNKFGFGGLGDALVAVSDYALPQTEVLDADELGALKAKAPDNERKYIEHLGQGKNSSIPLLSESRVFSPSKEVLQFSKEVFRSRNWVIHPLLALNHSRPGVTVRSFFSPVM